MTVGEQTETARCRPFTIVDGMILVAGSAAYLALARGYMAIAPLFFHGIPFERFVGIRDVYDYLKRNPAVIVGTLFFVAWFQVLFALILSAVFVAVRLRRPRPTLCRLAGQPGVAGLLALAGGIGLVMITGLCSQVLGLRLPAVVAVVCLSSMIPLAWGWLAVTGRWRPEPGWIDGTGCLVVGLWAVVIPTWFGLAWAMTRR